MRGLLIGQNILFPKVEDILMTRKLEFLSLVVKTFFILGAVVVANPVSALDVGARERQPASKIKNVLLVVSDDLKASVLGCYGDRKCETPNIDKLAARSMVFDAAYCQGTVCRPSRESFMHSRYKGKTKINLGSHFIDNGFYSARVGKIYHMRVPGDIIAGTNGEDVASSWTERFNSPGPEAHTPGDYACLNLNVFSDKLENRESTQTKNRMFVTVEVDGDGSSQADHKTATKAIEILRTRHIEPFFLAVGFVRPHYPMVAPRQFFGKYPWSEIALPQELGTDLDDIPKLGLAGTQSRKNPIGNYPDNQKRMWTGYYASVSFMDEQVGRLLDELDRLGIRDSTAIVFTSDHGYHLGEHGFWQKSNLHEEVIRVPLMISAPGLETGRSQSIVELMDIFPTLAELAGLEIPKTVQGRSLVPVLKDPNQSVREGALSFSNGVSFRSKDWHLMHYKDDTYELYDMTTDPLEFNNLAKDAAYESKLKELDGKLLKRLEVAGMKL